MRNTQEKSKDYKKGLWTVEEDNILTEYVELHGTGHWNQISNKTGLKRRGKSCRLRWMNYLSPNLKKGNFSDQEQDLIIRLHKLLGNRWSLIAKRVPGRTDNQVKNYWHTHISKRIDVKEKSSKATEFCSFFSSIASEVSKTCNETAPSSSKTFDNLLDDDDTRGIGFTVDDKDRRELEIAENDMNPLWIPEDNFDFSSLMMMNFWDDFCF